MMIFWLQVSDSYRSSRTTGEDNAMSVLALSIVVLVVAIAWRVFAYFEYNKAKENFEQNPTDSEAKQNLILAARYNGRYGRSTNEVMAMLEVQHDAEKRQTDGKKSIASELERLVDLKGQGVLNEVEFEKAKAKLLN